MGKAIQRGSGGSSSCYTKRHRSFFAVVSDYKIAVLATDLKIHTFHGLVQRDEAYVFPTFDGRLVTILPDGTGSTLVQFCQGFACEAFGQAFGIVHRGEDYVLTVSSFHNGGRLIQVSPAGTVTPLVDLTPLTPLGAPFGLATDGPDLLVTLSPQVLNSEGTLVRVAADGQITTVADLSDWGIPFAVVVQNGQAVVAQERRVLVRVSVQGERAIAAQFPETLGIPLALTVHQQDLVVALNSGALVRVRNSGEIEAIADLLAARHGIPTAVVSEGDRLVVATTAGRLLRLSPA